MTERPRALSPNEVKTRLAGLSEWSLRDDKLFAIFRFASFPRAIAFMASAVEHIESVNHHPEWRNVYDRVEISLITHEVRDSKVAAISDWDFDLAQFLSGLPR